MSISILILVLYCAARIAEAYRDAEAFERPKEDRSRIWHWLKYVQFSCLFGMGYFYRDFDLTWWLVLLTWLGWGLVGWVVFELSLKWFRKSYR